MGRKKRTRGPRGPQIKLGLTPGESADLLKQLTAEGGEITALIARYANGEMDFETLKARFVKLDVRPVAEPKRSPFGSAEWWQEVEDSMWDEVEIGTWEEVDESLSCGLITAEESAELREAWFAERR